MAIEVRCIEHLSVEQRQSLHLLYGPLMGKSSICLYEFLGSIQNSVELEDIALKYIRTIDVLTNNYVNYFYEPCPTANHDILRHEII